MESWQKLLVAAGAAAGAGALLCVLLKDDDEATLAAIAKGGAAPSASADAGGQLASGLTKAQFLEVLNEIVETKTKRGNRLKDVSKKFAAENEGSDDVDFDKIYALVSEPANELTEDPLEKRGLTPEVIDQGIQRWGDEDPEVQRLLMKMMQPEVSSDVMPKDIALDVLVKLHEFMADEVEAFLKTYEALPDKSKYDGRTVMMAFQVSLDSKVLKQFKIESEDVQAAIMAKQNELQDKPEFIKVFQKFQENMGKLMQKLPGISR